jgi:hypothetical protein
MRKMSWSQTVLMGLRLATWQERLGWALAAVLALALLAAIVAQGENIGAHIWRPGWACGETLKGGPACIPDRTASPGGAREAP